MDGKAYYNENNKYAAQWLRNLIADGQIAPGEVDERSIVDVQPDDLRGFTQCHFFAGIGGWSIALRLAGWPNDRPVWTGSCPCQPFSSAGKQKGHADERHLWPYWSRLIGESKPATIFGEQVASAIAYGWLDEVSVDLEEKDYAVASAVLPACSIGAPHKRDRIWFVANSESERIRREQRHIHKKNGGQNGECLQQSIRAIESIIPNAEGAQTQWKDPSRFQSVIIGSSTANTINVGREGSLGKEIQRKPRESRELERGFAEWNNGWPISAPKICSVDDGIFSRTPKLRAYGNAIVPQVAAEFIKAALDSPDLFIEQPKKAEQLSFN